MLWLINRMSCLSLETKARIIMCTTTRERERERESEREMKGEEEGKEGERET